jgi:hypothetical protein
MENNTNQENHVEVVGAGAGASGAPTPLATAMVQVVTQDVAAAEVEAAALAVDGEATTTATATANVSKEGEEGANAHHHQQQQHPQQQKTVQHSVRKDSATWVYDHWVAATSSAEGSKQKFSCKYCKNAQYRHNVTRMRNHLINCCMAPEEAKETARLRCTVIAERKDTKKSEKKSKLERDQGGDFPSGLGNKKRKTLDGTSKKQGMDASVDNNKLDLLFAKAYSSLKLAPECLDNPKLINFLEALNPQYRLPSLNTVRSHQIQLKLTTETFDDGNAASNANATNSAPNNASAPMANATAHAAAGEVAEYREPEEQS